MYYQLIVSVSLLDFYCNLPSQSNTKLEFNCREPSCGALERDEKAAKLADDDYTVDPNFFDSGYSMAGSTGFKVGYHFPSRTSSYMHTYVMTPNKSFTFLSGLDGY